MTNFRIFIDAATLKQQKVERHGLHDVLFPHLYRCGHIEATGMKMKMLHDPLNFRIFIDAATLKRGGGEVGAAARSDFRIFIDAATLKQ